MKNLKLEKYLGSNFKNRYSIVTVGEKPKRDFLRDKDWSRIFLLIALALSLAFNVVLYKDNAFMTGEFLKMKHNFIEDVVGYNYCDKD